MTVPVPVPVATTGRTKVHRFESADALGGRERSEGLRPGTGLPSEQRGIGCHCLAVCYGMQKRYVVFKVSAMAFKCKMYIIYVYSLCLIICTYVIMDWCNQCLSIDLHIDLVTM